MTKQISSKLATYISAIENALDVRTSYEIAQIEALKSANLTFSENILKTLADIRKSMTHEACAKSLLASNVDVAFINRQERNNKRMNVYCIEKIDNIARVIAKVSRLNAYTRNVFLTAVNLSRHEDAMTHKDAQASLALDLKARNAHIVRYAKHIAVSTANTQSSSSINALQIFNILKETRNNANEVAYVVDFDNVNTIALLALVA